MKTFKEYNLEKKLDKYVSDEIKKRKLARFPVNATDDYQMKKGKPTFKFPSPNLINALLPQPEAKDIPKPKHIPPTRLANH